MEFGTEHLHKMKSILMKTVEVTDDTITKTLEEIEKISRHILGIFYVTT
jgi:transcription initiation factor IIE alpha subunit